MNSGGDSLSDSGEEEWGTAELIIPPPSAAPSSNGKHPCDDSDDDWNARLPSLPQYTVVDSGPSSVPMRDEKPLILVDFTQIDQDIHCRFDRHSVSDSVAASALRKRIEASFDVYAKDAALLSAGTVIPCGASVWKDALVRLREERPGHYFCPIFPPK